MHYILVMQLRNSSEASLEDFLPIRRRQLSLSQAQEVVCQVFIHKDAFAGDGIRGQTQIFMVVKSGSYDPIEVRVYFRRNILQDELVMSTSVAPLSAQCSNHNKSERSGGRCQPDAAKMRPLLDQFFEDVTAP